MSAPDSQQPSARARGHGEFIRHWDSNAQLRDSEVEVCSEIEAHYRSYQPIIQGKLSTGEEIEQNGGTAAVEETKDKSQDPDPHDTDPSSVYKGMDGLKGLATVTTPEEFHLWHDEMERRLQDANEEKYRTVIDKLTQHGDVVSNLVTITDEALKALDRITTGRKFVEDVVTTFKSDCENMVSERKKMADLADALRKRLTYFEELETLTSKFSGGKAAINPDNPDFVKLLHRLDECVAYASSSTGAVAEADGYLARFLELQRRAFTAIREFTVKMLNETAMKVAKELREDRMSGAGFRHADLTDASKEYLRFRTIAPKVKSLMAELSVRSKSRDTSRSGSMRSREFGSNPTSPYARTPRAVADPFSNPESANLSGMSPNSMFSTQSAAMSLLADCEECFFEQRRLLLEPSVAAHVKSLADVKNMIALARLGSAYVLRVCQLERQLYEHFFPLEGSDGDQNPLLLGALRSLCDMVYTELRPQILQENDLDKLVYLIEVLKTEILGDEVPRRGFAGKAFAPSAIRAIADAQERIIYRAEVYMRDEIRGFVPEAEHLDYPERIMRHEARRSLPGTPTSKSGSPSTRDAAAKPGGDTSARKSGGPGKPGNADTRSVGIYATWYPPVERTLRLLSMLYRCVDGKVFAGVAQEAVAICVQSIGSAAAQIASSNKPHADDHAQLFLVWQLLMTREQISPFDVEMSYTEHELDFFELRSLLGNVIRGHISARHLAARPAIRERVVDSKRDLDHAVRGACESLILKTTRVLLDPVLSFLARCNALPTPSERPRTPAGKGDRRYQETPFDALKANTGSFAHPKRLAEMWQSVRKAVSDDLPPVVDRMKIYITKSASRAVLLRPIRANIAEAATELLSALQLRYTIEEREEIGLDGEVVGQILDEVDRIIGIGTKTPRSTRSQV